MITRRDEGFRRRPDTPRKVRNGIRLRRKEEEVDFAWPAGPWLSRVLRDVDETSREEGLDFARKGQTVVLDIEPGRIVAEVQDVEARPHVVRIEFAAIGREDWKRVVDSMAREARYAAKLVSGEISPEIAEPFAAAGIALLPEDEEITIHTAGGRAGARHLATVAYLVAERMEQDPLLVLTLRGLFGPRFLERLQEARLLATSGVSRAHPVPQVASGIRDAENQQAEGLDAFWTPGSGLDAFRRDRHGDYLPHALLRRLGTAPLEGRFPLVGLLASIYDDVSNAARSRIEALDDASVTASPTPPPAED
ncbi:MAG: hypothetical protein CMJ34_06010 [Phycisphaerae bacterium]|nr:hypothetical protein [Phycisphaerae bacterium]